MSDLKEEIIQRILEEARKPKTPEQVEKDELRAAMEAEFGVGELETPDAFLGESERFGILSRWAETPEDARKGDLRLARTLCRARRAAQRLTLDEFDTLAQASMAYARKDVLTHEEHLAQIRRRAEMDDHPRVLPFAYLILLQDERAEGPELPEWFARFMDEKVWEWQWWSDYFGQTVREYTNTLAEPCIAYIENYPTRYPEGWKPEGRQ